MVEEGAAPAWRSALWRRRYWIAAAVAVVAAAAFVLRPRAVEPYRTAEVDRGEILRVVSATGALQPLVSVNVGSTVSGPVESVEADFNAAVRAGQVLARLDPQTFRQRVVQAQASLRQAEASYDVAQSDYDRYARLSAEGFASPQLIAQKRAARDRAFADVAQARAALASAQTDLDRTIIRSPIDGVVVDRQVNPGQSVAASFQAPTLFVIAQNLERLQANITVDESDIGEVREGMPVRFTVDAFPSESFEARVAQVRQRGVETQGVVSYTVVVDAPNPDRRLLPGMTANAEIVVENQRDVLRLPSAALRFRPADPALQARAAELLASGQGSGGAASAPRRQREGAGAGARRPQGQRPAIVWVERGGQPEPVRIVIGSGDERFTRVAAGALRPGDRVIVGGGPSPRGAAAQQGGQGARGFGGPPPGAMRMRM